MEAIAAILGAISSVVVILDWLGITPMSVSRKTPKLAIMTVLLVLTWAAVGFDY